MGIDPESVLASLTLEQKITLLAGADNWHTAELPGVPAMRCSDVGYSEARIVVGYPGVCNRILAIPDGHRPTGANISGRS